MQVIARLTPLLGRESHGLARLFELLDVALGGNAPLSHRERSLSPFYA